MSERTVTVSMAVRMFLCLIFGSQKQQVISLSPVQGLLLILAGWAMAAPSMATDELDWATTVSKVADSVVALKLSHLRDFDDSDQGSSNATGFVVDAERGIVLTNRHVVGAGPIRVSATFQNQERVDAVPLYRDPVHDFAFVRYDPDTLRYAQPASLALRPDKAHTGLNIRVIGSDGGEQLSILPGTIARLDREVPSYRRYGYNDFNTFYMQAASGTSGGSSGSPVIDIDGDVVALNAAANTRTASSFFLPLGRIKHALEKIQADQAIDRGSFQTLFAHTPFRELSRLGLDEATELMVRNSSTSPKGMLVVKQVIPGGTAKDLLEPGDILVSIDGSLITVFDELEALLDSAIGRQLQISLIRQGKPTNVLITVADLHALAPRELLEMGDAVLQNMSIQHARAMNRAQDGVVVTRPGYIFDRANIPDGAVIVAVEDQKVSDLGGFVRLLEQTADVQKKRIRYIVPGREFTTELAQLSVDNKWFSHRRCMRVDDRRFWDCEAISLPDTKPSPDLAGARAPRFQNELLSRVAPAMVKVEFSIPYTVDNVYARHFSGVGLVVDKESGLIVVDRNTVPIALGDAELTFFGSLKLPANVVFLHPRHNIAILQYDVNLIDPTQFDALELSEKRGDMPDDLTMIGYRKDGTFRQHDIDDISHLTVAFRAPGLARFQQSAADLYSVPDVPPSLGGPLVDENGLVHALYMSFAFEEGREILQKEWAMPAAIVTEALRAFKSAKPYFSLDINLSYQPLATARQLGLPYDWLERYHQLPAERRRVLYIDMVVPETDADEKLNSGDVLLAIDDQLVSDLFTAEKLAQQQLVGLTVLRSGKVVNVQLRPSGIDVNGTSRLVRWAGATFQSPHPDIGFHKGVDVEGVYIAHTEDGSPAIWDGLYRNRFVIAIDGEPVESLDEFAAAVHARDQDEITRLTLVSMKGIKSIVTVQPEYNFWPTFEIRRTQADWQRINFVN
ncbi:MAG: trypsin-like peptidase domain-containing protein [Granulosicoccus sp.]